MLKDSLITPSELEMRPIDLFRRIRTEFTECAILESLDKTADTSRYTIVGIKPMLSLKELNGQCHLYNFDTGENSQVNWQSVLPLFTSVQGHHTAPQLGAIGYIGYEKNRDFEQVKCSVKSTTSIPDSYLVRYRLMYWWDHQSRRGFWVHDKQTSPTDIEQLSKKIESVADLPDKNFSILGDIESDFTEQEYLHAVEKTLKHIRQGDIFQANITTRYSGAFKGDPLTLYLQLREHTPNPFFAYLDFDYPVISTSPERFFRVREGIIDTYPIKGTRKVEPDFQCVTEAKEALESSEKDRAENTMIVDLMRNDLSRICEKGSVDVTGLCIAKRFNHLIHLESRIAGKLRPNADVYQILKALFPAGSITGAPKIKAMEIIDEIEPYPRKVYCGSIGFFGAEGYIDTSVAIRTLYFDDSNLYFHSGGGIVIDSSPQDELKELRDKVQSISSVLNQNNILKPLRLQLDGLDRQLMEVIALRMDVVKKVGVIKEKYQIPLMQSDRVNSMKLERQQLSEKLGLPYEFTDKLFDLLIETAMKLEGELETEKTISQ